MHLTNLVNKELVQYIFFKVYRLRDKILNKLTYYVVAQMGQNNLSSYLWAFCFNNYYFATDYMLETVSFVYCLLLINTFYLYKLDVSRYSFLLSSENNNTTISNLLMDTQSAEN